ncbi:hypothetical protein [Chlorobium sp. N1]|uniref:hypothetical protein n=1 Tax=Chlorobium sp. N1 TaxID=2491138 RepID=UPI001038D617|nr:hypothetical protein [Chlorobium sp. N1]TCD48540.1 hypothetical protein E0L29_01270 [Chlorobium sp. N1]
MLNALILGLRENTAELLRLLEEKGLMVTIAESVQEIPQLRQDDPGFRLAFLTDSFPEAMNVTLLAQVKTACRPECMVCLSDHESDGQERILRSAGLVFLGSYQRFLTLADRIIQTTLCASERKDCARKLEERLMNNDTNARWNPRRNAIRANMVLGRIAEKVTAVLRGKTSPCPMARKPDQQQ